VACIYDNWQSNVEDAPDALNAHRRNGRSPADFNQELQQSISKKYLRLGRMALSEGITSIRAIRDTSVADYSAPGINSTSYNPYHPLIAVAPFLLVLGVSYWKPSLLHYGKL
jgi:hypothetical protein